MTGIYLDSRKGLVLLRDNADVTERIFGKGTSQKAENIKRKSCYTREEKERCGYLHRRRSRVNVPGYNKVQNLYPPFSMYLHTYHV